MFAWTTYWSETEVPGVGDQYNIVNPYTGDVHLYVKSVDVELGILETVAFDGYMANGRPRPILRYGKLVTHARIVHFDVVDKRSGTVLYRVRKG